MKKVLFVGLVLTFAACHSISTETVSSDSTVVKSIDSLSVANDSVKVDSVKVIDSVKSK